MDVELPIDDQGEIWEARRQRLEALNRAFPSQQQHDPTQHDKIVDPLLFSAAEKGVVDEFIRALEDHCAKERVSLPVLLGLRGPCKNTLLHAAAESDDIVRAVIDFVPQHLIYCENSRGETPLHIAARAGKAVAVELLLPQGMLGYPDRCGNSALHEAVRKRRHKVISQLVSKDPNLLYRPNKESKSPLCVAVETGDLKVLDLLLDAPNNGEDQRRSESQMVFGMSPAHVAIICREKGKEKGRAKGLDMLTKMWEKKPWLFQLRDAGHGTPLHYAVYEKYLDGVKFLIEKFPTSALEEDNMGYLPIHVACMMNHIEIVKELLRQWPDPAKFPTQRGENILHVSARYGCIATVEYILKNPKFDHLINARDFDGNAPLHLAALHCEPSVVLLARHERADVNLVNNNHMTALDVVEQNIKAMFPPWGQWLTWRTLTLARTCRSPELAICKPNGRRLRKRLDPPIDRERHWEAANARAVVAALMASVTFTAGFSVPGGYNSSERDAGIPILLHKAMFNVFVISNSLAMYSSITALGILLQSYVGDPYVGKGALVLAGTLLWVTFAATLLAFMAGVYGTVSKLAWLSIFGLVLVSVTLSVFLSAFMFFIITFWPGHSLIRRRFAYKLLLWGLSIIGGDTAFTSVRGT